MKQLLLSAAILVMPSVLLRAESPCVPRTHCMKQKTGGWKDRLNCLKPKLQLPLAQICPQNGRIPSVPRCEPTRFRIPICIPQFPPQVRGRSCETARQPHCDSQCLPQNRFEAGCRSGGEAARRLMQIPQGRSQLIPHSRDRVVSPQVVVPQPRVNGQETPRLVVPPIPSDPIPTQNGQSDSTAPNAASSRISVPVNLPEPATSAQPVPGPPVEPVSSDELVRTLEILVETRRANSVEAEADSVRLNQIESDLQRLHSKVDRLTKAVAAQNSRLRKIHRVPAAD